MRPVTTSTGTEALQNSLFWRCVGMSLCWSLERGPSTLGLKEVWLEGQSPQSTGLWGFLVQKVRQTVFTPCCFLQVTLFMLRVRRGKWCQLAPLRGISLNTAFQGHVPRRANNLYCVPQTFFWSLFLHYLPLGLFACPPSMICTAPSRLYCIYVSWPLKQQVLSPSGCKNSRN